MLVQIQNLFGVTKTHYYVSGLSILCLFTALFFLRGCMTEHRRGHGQSDVAFAVSPQQDVIVFAARGCGGQDLYLLRLADSSVSCIAASPEYESDPVFTPDGKSVVYTAGVSGERADHVFVRSLDEKKKQQLTHGSFNDMKPGISPDGNRVVFIRDKTYVWGGLAPNWDVVGPVCTVAIDSLAERQITGDDINAYAPLFSRDGNSISYWMNYSIYLMADDKISPPKPIWKNKNVYFSSIARSKDNKLIAYGEHDVEFDDDILYLSNMDGESTRELVPKKGRFSSVTFSHDNKRLFYLLDEWPDGQTGELKKSLWEVSIDGSCGPRKIADYGLFDSPLTWVPSRTDE